MSAGLPNITGSTEDRIATMADIDKDFDAAGAFKFSSWLNMGTKGSNAKTAILNFDASRCSSIYGNANTVQPPSVTAIYAIKY